MRLIGHRGAAALAPENTLPSFEAAVVAGVDAVEFDVRMAADGVVVVMHDDEVSSTTGAPGRVSEMSFEQLRTLDVAAVAGWPERLAVPTLDEVLLLVADRVGVVVEVKATLDERGFRSAVPVVEAIAERVRGQRDVVLSSFDPAAVAAARELIPGVRTALSVLPGFPLEAALAAASAAGHVECHPDHRAVDGSFVEAAHERGIAVACWTVNEPDRARELRALGVDAIFTDDPVAIGAALGR